MGVACVNPLQKQISPPGLSCRNCRTIPVIEREFSILRSIETIFTSDMCVCACVFACECMRVVVVVVVVFVIKDSMFEYTSHILRN